jgi:hypothetical protein
MILIRSVVLIFLIGIAITACYTNVTKTDRTSVEISLQNTENNTSPLALSFSKSSYAQSDTIKLSLLNKTDSDVVIGLRCGFYLEMSYQKSVSRHWSENNELWYMSLKCPTHSYTIRPHEKYDFSVPSSRFNSTGIFRLLVSYTVSTENTTQTITSVPFEIR